MKVYTVLVSIDKEFNELADDTCGMAKCLIVSQKYFKVVKSCHYLFGKNQYTLMLILAESHIAIQTYPELQKVFVSIEYHEEDESDPRIDIHKYVRELVEVFDGSVNTVNVYVR